MTNAPSERFNKLADGSGGFLPAVILEDLSVLLKQPQEGLTMSSKQEHVLRKEKVHQAGNVVRPQQALSIGIAPVAEDRDDLVSDTSIVLSNAFHVSLSPSRVID